MNHSPENSTREYGLAISQATSRYHRDLTEIFERRFEGEIIRADVAAPFSNGMPLYLVGSAEKVMYLSWMPEDSFEEAFTQMCMFGAGFTENPDEAGPNAKHLGYFFPFFDARFEHRGRKVMPDGKGKAIIKSQVATVPILARAIRHVANGEYIGTLDLHSYLASQIFESNGVRVLNITAARLFAQKIQSLEPNPTRQRVIVTTDAGDFNRAIPFQKHLNADLAVILKIRDPEGESKKNNVTSQLVYGSVAGKDVFILDDSISGGTTLKETLDALEGAESITYCATHPIFVDDYYIKLEEALEDPRIRRVIVTDSLPTKYRKNLAAMPYAQLPDGSFKEIEIIKVGYFLADAAYTILHAETLDDAKEQLGTDIWDMKDPDALFTSITGLPSPTLPDTGVYLGRKKIVTLFEFHANHS